MSDEGGLGDRGDRDTPDNPDPTGGWGDPGLGLGGPGPGPGGSQKADRSSFDMGWAPVDLDLDQGGASTSMALKNVMARALQAKQDARYGQYAGAGLGMALNALGVPVPASALSNLGSWAGPRVGDWARSWGGSTPGASLSPPGLSDSYGPGSAGWGGPAPTGGSLSDIFSGGYGTGAQPGATVADAIHFAGGGHAPGTGSPDWASLAQTSRRMNPYMMFGEERGR